MASASTEHPSGELVRPTPWPALFPWNSHLNQLLESMWHAPALGHGEPAAAVTETEDAYRVELDLPGVERKNVTLDVTGRRMSVHATRAEREHEGILRHSTRTTGEFDFVLNLPTAIADEGVTATMNDGVLTVTLPKTAGAKSTRIKIG